MEPDKKQKEQYGEMVKKATPKSPHLSHWIWSILVGGAICALGEGIAQICKAAGVTQEHTKIIVPCSLVVLTAIFTGLGLFCKLAKHAGAGTAVPISGFANSIVSAAMEHHPEGLVLGVGANMFRLAGPVLVYGTAVCTLYGILYYFFLR